jgi:hypothetical protein
MRTVTGESLGGTGDEEIRRWRYDYAISRPGKEREVRTGWSSAEGVNAAFNLLDLLNEFGAEGWELISESVLDSIIFSERHGWSQVGGPVQIKCILKREVSG